MNIQSLVNKHFQKQELSVHTPQVREFIINSQSSLSQIPVNVEDILQTVATLRKGNFTSQAEKLETKLQNIMIHNDFVIKAQDYKIILKRPPFIRYTSPSSRLRKVTAHQIEHGKYIVECRPQEYIDEIPLSIAEASIQLQKDGFTPVVYPIVNQLNLYKYASRFVGCPLLVGVHNAKWVYQKYGDDYGHTILQPTPFSHVVVAAMWGKDIEDLDEYFGKESAC